MLLDAGADPRARDSEALLPMLESLGKAIRK
jgi:hypothetical protein